MRVAWHRSLLPQVLDDLRGLSELDEELVDAALRAISDLASRRRIGKALGARLVSGDLEGYRPTEGEPDTVEVISVGPRGGHAVYQEAVTRLDARPGTGEGT